MGACAGKSNTRAVLVQARKPLPISASLAWVSSRMMEVLPVCTLPINQTTGAKLRARSAIGSEASAEVVMADEGATHRLSWPAGPGSTAEASKARAASFDNAALTFSCFGALFASFQRGPLKRASPTRQ